MSWTTFWIIIVALSMLLGLLLILSGLIDLDGIEEDEINAAVAEAEQKIKEREAK